MRSLASARAANQRERSNPDAFAKSPEKISADKVLILLFCGLLGFLYLMNAHLLVQEGQG